MALPFSRREGVRHPREEQMEPFGNQPSSRSSNIEEAERLAYMVVQSVLRRGPYRESAVPRHIKTRMKRLWWQRILFRKGTPFYPLRYVIPLGVGRGELYCLRPNHSIAVRVIEIDTNGETVRRNHYANLEIVQLTDTQLNMLIEDLMWSLRSFND